MFGRAVHEPMTDLFHLFSRLVTNDGKILIPGIEERVKPLTAEERCLLETETEEIKRG
jgi:Cys-Gly metallodipeptidase DUG1